MILVFKMYFTFSSTPIALLYKCKKYEYCILVIYNFCLNGILKTIVSETFFFFQTDSTDSMRSEPALEGQNIIKIALKVQ